MSLSDAEKARAKELFDKYDKDNSGFIDREEFAVCLGELMEIDVERTKSYINLKFRVRKKFNFYFKKINPFFLES